MHYISRQIILLSLCIAVRIFLFSTANAALPSNTPGTLQHTLGGHGGEILDASWSPDSKYVITGSEDKTAIIWDAISGKRLHTLQTDYKFGVRKVHWSPDGTKVSTGGDESDIWDTRTGNKLLTIKGVIFGWSPDGKWMLVENYDSTACIRDGSTLEVVQVLKGTFVDLNVAQWSADSKKILTRSAKESSPIIWEVPSGNKLLTLSRMTSYNFDIYWSADGSRIVAMRDSLLISWDAVSGAIVSTVKVGNFCRNFSPDGTKVILNNSISLIIYDTKSGTRISTLDRHSDRIRDIAWSPDSRHLATVSDDNTAILWDTETGAKLYTLQGHRSNVVVVRWSPDSSRIVTGGGQYSAIGLREANPDFTTRIWDARSGRSIHIMMPHIASVTSVCWSPDGSRLASCSADSTTIIWNATTGDTLHILGGHVTGVDNAYWSPSGDRILTRGGDSNAILWDAISGKRLFTLESFSENRAANWSPDGRQIATTNLNSTLIWDAATGKIINTLLGHTAPVNDAVWSADGKYIATASEDRTSILWDALSGEKLTTLSTSKYPITTVSWSPDGSRIAVPSGKTEVATVVWDVHTRSILFTVPKNGAVWYPDGKRLLVERTIYDGFTGVYLDSLSAKVLGAHWSPDRTQFARYYDGYGNSDSSKITIYDGNSGNELYDLYRLYHIREELQWSPDGTRIASAGEDNTARIWLINTSTSVQEEPTPLLNSAGFSLFPNPTDNSLHLSFATERALPSAVQICDLLGRTVATADIPAGTKEWTMSVSNLPAGVYAVRWGGVVQKLVVR